MEHEILEQSTGVESVSTIKIFGEAQADNIPMHTITKENLPGEINALAVSDQVKQEIKSSVHAGKVIVIPEKEITLNQWSGVGYMVLDPDTFACGYMISGGLAGGAMTMGQAMEEYLTGIVKGLVYVLVYELIKTVAIAMLPLGGVTAALFFIVECILLLDYIDNIIQLWNMYNETGNVVYLQEAFIQISVFISMMAIIPQIKPQLEKFQKSLQETMIKLKEVPEYKEGVGACFIAGTLVLSAAGFVPIETVTAGELVQSFDPQTQKVSLKEVEETFIRETKEFVHVTVGDEKITTTPEHPFYVAQKGFVKAEKLRAGDILCTVNGEYVIVEQIQHEILESPVKVYNFRVAENHTYYVGRVGVGVHNATYTNNNGIKPEAAVQGSKKHGVNWKEGAARAKATGKPQGQWALEDLEYATKMASTLKPKESGYFELPPDSKSIVHMPNGEIKKATKFWIRNNGTGTWHGYPME